MFLSDLENIYPQIKTHPYRQLAVNNFHRSNKELEQNTVFVAIRGTTWDGHTAIQEALNKGCSLVVCEHANIEHKKILIVKDTRLFYTQMAALFYQNSQQKLKMLAVTGTNGKTTVTYMTEHIWQQLNKNIAVIGTVDHHLGSYVWPTSLTSPDAKELHHRLQEFVEKQASACIIETSSHALAQDRVAAIDWSAAIFTNLSQDHLDYHNSMQEYFLAKAKLFTKYLLASNVKNKIAIINQDCEWGKKLIVSINNLGIKLKTYGKEEADLTFKIIKQSPSGMHISFVYQQAEKTVALPFFGEHNAYNAAAAMLSLLVEELNPLQGAELLTDSFRIPGRLERIVAAKDVFVFVDYAHSPDALEQVLSFLQQVKTRRLLTVFGCGGDRDKAKRPLMARVAEIYSDYMVLTADNPRSEEPLAIIDDMKRGLSSTAYEVIADRKEAICKTLQQAKSGDIVLIAGKGHENYQEIKGKRVFFSDQAAVEEFYK